MPNSTFLVLERMNVPFILVCLEAESRTVLSFLKQITALNQEEQHLWIVYRLNVKVIYLPILIKYSPSESYLGEKKSTKCLGH